MNVLVDLTGCSIGSGLGIYAFRILSVWKTYVSTSFRIILLIKADMEVYIQNEYPDYEYIILKQVSCRSRFLRRCGIQWFINGLLWRNTIRRQQCEILFSPATAISSFWRFKKYRIQVIHDLQPLRVWKGVQKLEYRLCMPLILKRSDRIITISNFVKQDVLKTYSFLSADKIDVIYNGVPIPVSVSSNMKIGEKYLLYVNTLLAYKNIETLVRAFMELRYTIPHKLVIVGRSTPYWEEEVLPLIKQAGLEERVIHISKYVSDSEMASLYRAADLFVSPSLHEGFGYTPIEAALCHTPVICTKETALPEVTMGLLNYYEPATDQVALKNKIMEVLTNYPSQTVLTGIANTYRTQYDIMQQGKKVLDYIADWSQALKK